VPEDVQAEEEEVALRLSEALSEEFETEEASAVEEEPAAPAPAPSPAAWEQIGLFDEEEEQEEEAPPAEPARVELTPTFDFEASEPRKPAHEPEPGTEVAPFLAAAPRAEGEAEEEGEGEGEAEHAATARPVTIPPVVAKQDLVPQPVHAPRPEPSRALDEGEGWNKLVYDAGCLILEHKRVAVSLLERSFGIDFDQACRVLDELQQAGLIGPYMGGRTRDILLTREQWLPHAPHAS
jgi:DNA segregation ATPase FtsK/SpoIIIE-like protein